MKKFLTFLLIASLLAAVPLAAKWLHERQSVRIKLGDVTGDDAVISDHCWAIASGAVIVDSISFVCEGYDGTTGDYDAVGDSTVFFTLSFITWGSDTETLATYDSRLDSLDAIVDQVTMTINAGADTIHYGDFCHFNYQETDTTSGVLAIRDCIVIFSYQRIK